MSLPEGFGVRLVPDAVTLDDGSVLLGGSPLTAIRLARRFDELSDSRRLTVTDADSARVADRLLASNLALPDLDQPPASRDSLTVVIPVRDRPDQLDRCLRGLSGLTCLVVDDASVDPDAVAAVARRHHSRVIALPKNLGPAGARNAGLAQVRTEFVAFVDSDAEVSAEVLLELSRHFADPQVALVAPRVVAVTRRVSARGRRSRPRWYERYEAHNSSLDQGGRSATVRPGATVAWVPSACLVGRTAALADGFDPELRVGEDVDLVWRLHDAGWRVRYDADLTAAHDTRGDLRSWLGAKAWYGSSGAELARRHGDRVAPAVLSPSYAIAAAATLAGHWSLVPLTAVALLRGRAAVAEALPAGTDAGLESTKVAVRGYGWALRQESSLLLRHWWPLAALAALVSRRARRAVLSALAVDLVVMAREMPMSGAEIPSQFAARRLDDLAYGTGLWAGALQQRSIGALLPKWVRRS